MSADILHYAQLVVDNPRKHGRIIDWSLEKKYELTEAIQSQRRLVSEKPITHFMWEPIWKEDRSLRCDYCGTKVGMMDNCKNCGAPV